MRKGVCVYMEGTYCQSCGMPLIDEKEMGTDEDGSKNGLYSCQNDNFAVC